MKELDELHALLAEELKKRLLSGEASSAELNVIRQFLRDNGIDAVPKDGSPIGELLSSLPEHLRDNTYKQ